MIASVKKSITLVLCLFLAVVLLSDSLVAEKIIIDAPPPVTNTTLPGLGVTLSNDLLQLMQEVIQGALPLVPHTIPLAKNGTNTTVDGFFFVFDNIIVESFAIKSVQLGIQDSNILVKLLGVSGTVPKMLWSVHSTAITDSGTANINFALNITFLVNPVVNNGSTFLLSQKGASVAEGNIETSFTGGLSFLYNILGYWMQGYVKSMLVPEIIAEANQHLHSLSYTLPLATIKFQQSNISLDLSYRQISNAEYAGNLISILLQGALFVSPPNLPSLPGPTVSMPLNATGQMIQLFVNDYLINSGLYQAYLPLRSGILLTVDNSGIPSTYFNSCNSDLGRLFGKLCSTYPNATLAYSIKPENPPTWTTSQQGSSLAINSSVVIYASNSTNATQFTVVSLELSAVLDVALNFSKHNFSADISTGTLSVHVVESTIGSLLLLPVELPVALGKALNVVNKHLTVNIGSMLELVDLAIKDPSITYEQGYFYASTDLKIHDTE